MDDNLTQRYQALFQAYAVGSNKIVFKLKKKIEAEVSSGLLRIDAAFFLLLNADQMVVRALSGAIDNPITGQPRPEVLTESDLETNALKYLKIVLDDLRNNAREKPVSAHEILNSLNRTWSQMGLLFQWI